MSTLPTNGQPQTPAQKQMDTIKDLLFQNREQLAMALPKLMTPERLIRVAMNAIAKTPKLLECHPMSLMGAVLQCAELGLEPGILGHVYLVPFRNNKAGRTDVQFIPGYKGLLVLARRSGEIDRLDAQEVRQHDQFDYELGLNPTLTHRPPKSGKRGEITHFYAFAKLKSGEIQFCVMTAEEINEHRDRYSKAAQDGPWKTNYREMGLKTVLRRLAKLLPVSTELQQAIALDEEAETQLPQGLTALTGLSMPEEDPAREAEVQKSELADVHDKLKQQREQAPSAPAPAAPSDAHPKATAAGPVNGSEASERPELDAKWLSDVLDAEDFLRQTQKGKGTLRSIRAGFKLEGSDYPMLPEHQAEYLTTLQNAVKRMEQK